MIRLASFALATAIAFAATGVAHASPGGSGDAHAQERAYLRTVSPLGANDVTANLRGVVGKRVAWRCEIVAIVDRATMIGQCGKDIEPVDIYVHMPTSGKKIGDRVRVIGEMETPSLWVDVSGHPWYTGFMKARYVDRL